MTVCVDTNVVLQMRGATARHRPLLQALSRGVVKWAITTDILLEYEEVIVQRSGQSRWQELVALMRIVSLRHGTLLLVEPHFRFNVITADGDDNKFTDCAITSNADYVITNDAHFAPLANAGYRPQPIMPEDFITRFLTGWRRGTE